jgi:hypothetical protein
MQENKVLLKYQRSYSIVISSRGTNVGLLSEKIILHIFPNL